MDSIRAQIITAGNGLIQDAVITGNDNNFIDAIIFATLDYCKKVTGLDDNKSLHHLINSAAIQQQLQQVLNKLAVESTGGATLIKRAMFADFILHADKGEITDKRSFNHQLVIRHHPEVVEKIYSSGNEAGIIEIEK